MRLPERRRSNAAILRDLTLGVGLASLVLGIRRIIISTASSGQTLGLVEVFVGTALLVVCSYVLTRSPRARDEHGPDR